MDTEGVILSFKDWNLPRETQLSATFVALVAIVLIPSLQPSPTPAIVSLISLDTRVGITANIQQLSTLCDSIGSETRHSEVSWRQQIGFLSHYRHPGENTNTRFLELLQLLNPQTSTDSGIDTETAFQTDTEITTTPSLINEEITTTMDATETTTSTLDYYDYPGLDWNDY